MLAVQPTYAQSSYRQTSASCRWETRFARLVRRYGAAKLARDLQVDLTAIYQWVWGQGSPRPETALTLITLLRPIGRISLEDICHHRLLVTIQPLKTAEGQTKFARLVNRYGAERLARDLGVGEASVTYWLRGSFSPRLEMARKIVFLLTPVGRIRLEDIYRHRIVIRAAASVAQKVHEC